MTQNLLRKGASIIDRLYLPVCALFFCALIYNHLQLIGYKLPLDYNEAAMQTVTATIAAGENPFSVDNQPARSSGYPVLYNALVAAASTVFRNTLQLHRIVVGVFILASCLLVFLVTNKSSRSPRDSFAASLLLYAGLLYYSTPIASPTSLGMFFFLASLFIPWLHDFSNRSLIAALILGVLAFYGKQYCVASLGYIALYLFIAVSKKTGLVFGLASLGIFLASLAVANHTSAYFINNTIFSVKYATDLFTSNQTMFAQLYDYGVIYLPLLVILAMQLTPIIFMIPKLLKKGVPGGSGQPFFNLTNLDSPLFSRRPDYIWYCFTCSLIVIVFAIGKNPGNHLSYLFQMLSPFFLAGTFVIISRSVNMKVLNQLLVIAAFYSSFSMLSHDFSLKQEENWNRLAHLISGAHNVYGSPIILGEILRNGGEIYQNGHTNYFAYTRRRPLFSKSNNSDAALDPAWVKHIDKLYSMIATRKFDLIILDQWNLIPNPPPGTYDNVDGVSLLKKHYRRREVIHISIANRPGGGKYAMQIWEPIPTSSNLDIAEP